MHFSLFDAGCERSVFPVCDGPRVSRLGIVRNLTRTPSQAEPETIPPLPSFGQDFVGICIGLQKNVIENRDGWVAMKGWGCARPSRCHLDMRRRANLAAYTINIASGERDARNGWFSARRSSRVCASYLFRTKCEGTIEYGSTSRDTDDASGCDNFGKCPGFGECLCHRVRRGCGRRRIMQRRILGRGSSGDRQSDGAEKRA